MDTKEHFNIEDGTDLASFLGKNRRVLFITVLVIGIICVGFIAFMIVQDELNKRNTAALEPLIERYEAIIKGAEYAALNSKEAEQSGEADSEPAAAEADANLSAGEEAAAEEQKTAEDGKKSAEEKAPDSISVFLTDITAFAESHSGYPAAEAWSIAAHLNAKQEKWKEAEEGYLKSAEAGKKTHIAPVSFFNAAVCAEEQNKNSDAIKYYNNAAAFTDFPQGARAQFSVGRLHELEKNKEAARDAYQAVIDNWPDFETWTALAHRQLIALELVK
jgi:TolA-binding protein